MEQIRISPATLSGRITVPPSKSAAHRMLLCAALSDSLQEIRPACHSADIDATLRAARALGAEITETADAFLVRGISKNRIPTQPVTIDCGESGSTLRFLIPIAAALGIPATFIGQGRLPERPIGELTDLLQAHGVACSNDRLPLTIQGRLNAGHYAISGNISSQFLTGLLLALPLVEGMATVSLTTPLESAGYIDMTIEAMKKFGVACHRNGMTYQTVGRYTSTDATIEGDWSQACFFLAAAAGGGSIEMQGLRPDSVQGDRSAIQHFSKFGLTITETAGAFSAHRNTPLNAVTIDCAQIPDMVPALAVTAALAKGDTRLTGAGRLRIKESDRIKTTLAGLHAMGIAAEELPDGLLIHGGTKPQGGIIDGAGDHRIVMAFAMLAAVAESDTVINGFSAINKSYPTFFEDYQSLGGNAHVIQPR